MLYLSQYFKTYRKHYYELLNRVRRTGDWEARLDFFSEAVIATAAQAAETAHRIHRLSEQDLGRIAELGRAADSARRVQRAMLERPIATSGWLADRTRLTPATINKSLERLERLGIVRELTGRRRNRLFSYHRYIRILERGTE